MAEILLINPDIGFSWSRYLAKSNLPDGLLHVGTTLGNAGYNVKIIDQRVEAEWKTKIAEELTGETICVGISSMTGNQILNGINIAEIVRTLTDKPIVWGGIHPTLLPEQTLNHAAVDMVVRGEGEQTMLELVKTLAENASLQGIDGLSYMEEGRVVHNKDRDFINLDAFPHLKYELLDMRRYGTSRDAIRSANLNTSRGCVYHCKYCYASSFHKGRWRALSVENVIKRVTMLRSKYGISRFWFDDDEFFTNLSRARELMKELKKLNITWASRGARIDHILRMDGSFLDLMEKSGCHRLASGVESGSRRILELIDKRISPEDAIEANRKLSRYNIYPRFNFMMGFPTETVEDLRQSVALSLQIKKENEKAMFAPFSIFTPYPGCDLYELAVKNGFDPPDRLEKWANFRLTVDNTQWLSEDMKKIIKMLAFTSPFMNESIDTSPPFPVRLLSKVYRPIARQRIKRLFYRFPVEIELARRFGLYEN